MVNLICLGDIHLDARSPRYRHALEVLDHCLDVAFQRHATVVAVLGDVFEQEPTSGEYHAFLQRVYRIIEQGATVLICRGNHESYSAYSFFDLLSPMIKVAWDDFIEVDLGAARVLLIPYPVRGRSPFHEINQDTISGSMRAATELIAEQIREVAAKDARPLLVFGHVSIEGMTTRDMDMERHPPNEVVVPLAAFTPAALVRVGHIHRAQRLTATVRGVGSPLAHSFAEADDAKVFCFITVADDGTITTEDIPTECRGMREFAIELEALSGVQIREMEDAAAAGMEVKIVISMDATDAARYDPAVFDTVKATAPLFVLEKCVRPVTRVRAPELRADMTVTEEFFAWTQATGVVVADTKRIEEKLKEIV